MVEYRRIVPKTDTLEDLHPGNYISFPRDEEFPNMKMVYAMVPKEAFDKMKPIVPKHPEEWTWNKMFIVLTKMDEENHMALAVYKHDNLHYIVTIFHSDEYIDSL